MSTKPKSRKQAIDDHCKDCNYDELDTGTWRQQVAKCTRTTCDLYQFRPMPRSTSERPVLHGKSLQNQA